MRRGMATGLAFVLLSGGSVGPGDVAVAGGTAAPSTLAQGFWTRCGSIYCGSLTVPVNHPSPTGSADAPGAGARTIALPVYGRPSRTGFGANVLVLVADRETGQSARLLVERAPLTLGMASTDYVVVSLTVRDSPGAPMPGGDHAAAGTLAAVDDLRALLTALGVARVRVIGWGNGATIAAAWAMTRPATIVAAVLDSPLDPSSSMVRQGIARRDAMNAGVQSLMRWCASHMSCPMNQETRLSWRRMMKRLADGDAPAAVTTDLIALAGHAALHTGGFAAFFRALQSAFTGDIVALEALAASVPDPERATWRCADHRPAAARALAGAWTDTEKVSWRWFMPGDYAGLFAGCDTSSVATTMRRPLGALVPVGGARGARVYVTVARSDPTQFYEGPRALATKMKWKYRSVPAVRHLVVGHDRAITARIMSFLAG